MKHIVYIQKDERGEIFDDFAFSAYIGFKYKHHIIRFFQNIDEVPVDKNHLIVGSIENTLSYFNKLGINIPEPIHMPNELQKLSGRETYITTVDQLRTYDENKFPLFAKANIEYKKFIPGPIKNKKEVGYYLGKVSGNTSILISGYVNFLSEYRCFVREGQLKGIKHYIGDYKLFPDFNYINECIKTYKEAPIAYTLDVGITDKGDTKIIECNDAWSIGSYGFDSDIYAGMLLCRWIQITK